jgi:hypothetical protein
MSKSIKKFLNSNLNNLLTPISHKKNNTSSSPYNVNDKNIFKNNLERINKNTKKELSSKKNKDKQKSNEVLLNNYFSQRSRTNTEGNDVNIKKLKFTSNFLRNKIESMFNTKNSRNHSKKINFKNKNSENNNNFRTAKKVNYTKNIQNNNKKTNNNAHFTKLIANSNKKIIDGNSYINDFNITNSHNRSNTQTNFQKTNKRMSNSSHKLKSYSSKYRNARVCEDMKKTNLNKKITNQHKGNNAPNNIRQISPFYLTNNKISNTQNYFRNIYTKNKSKENQHDKEKQILITEPKEIKNVNKVDTNEFILKDNSSYLVISKKPTQITNFIEKKENNKYINNFLISVKIKKAKLIMKKIMKLIKNIYLMKKFIFSLLNKFKWEIN